MKNESTSIIMFDLGGVLFQLAGAEVVCGWTREGLTPPQLLERWLVSPSVRGFESGRIGFEAFRSGLKQELGLGVDDEAFDRVFAGWVTDAYPGAEALLRELSGRYALACFSNTNEVHWEILNRDYGLLPLFEYTFASFQMGVVKPDQEAFERVVAELGRPAAEIVFLDDSPANVEAAVACGLRAFRVDGVDGARRALVEAGIL